jgi:hypothetical protein
LFVHALIMTTSNDTRPLQNAEASFESFKVVVLGVPKTTISSPSVLILIVAGVLIGKKG